MSVSPLQTTQFDFETISDRLLHLAQKDRETVYQYLNSLKQNIDDLELKIIRQQIHHNPVCSVRVPLRLTATRGRTAFYPTPQPAINRMFEFISFFPNMRVLEPSAGLGHIALALRNKGIECDCFELDPLLQLALVKMGFLFGFWVVIS